MKQGGQLCFLVFLLGSVPSIWMVAFPQQCAMGRSISISVFLCSPWRIVDDCGGAFTMGAIGGGIFQAIKGFRNSPVVSKTIRAA